jgi:hypothetical protein
VPSAIETASINFDDDNAASQIKAIPFSDSTVKNRLLERTADVTDQFMDRLVQAT